MFKELKTESFTDDLDENFENYNVFKMLLRMEQWTTKIIFVIGKRREKNISSKVKMTYLF